jgi:hypothetical protein
VLLLSCRQRCSVFMVGPERSARYRFAASVSVGYWRRRRQRWGLDPMSRRGSADDARTKESRTDALEGLVSCVSRIVVSSEDTCSANLFDRQGSLPPGGEPSCDLCCAAAKSRLRADGVLAEINRSFALGAEGVTRERDGHCAGRCSKTPPLSLRPQVQKPGLAAFKERPDLARLERASSHGTLGFSTRIAHVCSCRCARVLPMRHEGVVRR